MRIAPNRYHWFALLLLVLLTETWAMWPWQATPHFQNGVVMGHSVYSLWNQGLEVQHQKSASGLSLIPLKSAPKGGTFYYLPNFIRLLYPFVLLFPVKSKKKVGFPMQMETRE